MKKHALFAAMALTALIAAGCGSSSSSSSSSAAASSSTTAVASSGSASGKCATSIAIEGPFTGPVAQVGLEQLHFAQLAVADFNKANGTNVTLNQDDTQLTPSIATTKTQAIIASPAVAVIGPSGSQEVEAVGPLLGRAGIAAVTGSATLPALTSSGANPTFLRVVPDDNVQGPQDANYIVTHLKPKAVLLVDDDEAYSQGLVKVMTPILTKAGIKVNHQTFNGTDTGATAANALSSLVTSQLTPDETVAILPWQSASNAQQFGLDAQQQHKKVILFGTDGTNSPSQFKIPGTYISTFGPDISTSTNPTGQGDRRRRVQVRPLRRLRRADLRGDPGRHAGDRVGVQGRADAESLERARGDQEDEHPRVGEPAGDTDRVRVQREPGRQPGLPVPRQRQGHVRRDSPQVAPRKDHD